jgi:hypothetical protein
MSNIIPINYSLENINKYINKYNITINKYNGKTNELLNIDTNIIDIFNIDRLKIPINIDLNKIYYFNIYIYNILIWNIPFELLLILSKNIVNKKYNEIKIDNNIFNYNNNSILKKYKIVEKGLPMNLLYSIIPGDIKISIISDIEFNYKINIINKIYNQNIKTILYNNNYIYKINIYKKLIIYKTNTIIKINMLSKGIFIKNKKIKKIEIKNNILNLKYNKNQLRNSLLIKKEKWNKYQKNTLYDIFNNILPNEIIYKINKYCKYNDKYIYWIPFEPNINWYDNNNNYIDLNSDTKIIINGGEKINEYILYIMGIYILENR